MKLGVFLPVGNNGWLISSTSPQFMPSFELNRDVTQAAERYGFDFVLSMIKLRGFGGPTQYWDHALESLTLMAGLAAVTERIRLFGTVSCLTIPPAIAARMAVTIDSISGGRFGLNMVTGWLKAEFEQMGLWPGEAHFARRYEYLTEYVTVMNQLWSQGRSDFRGDFFRMDDCRLGPLPSARIPLVSAGTSEAGMRFAGAYCDYNFCSVGGLNRPGNFAPMVQRLNRHAAGMGSATRALALTMIIADETDSAAMTRWERYKEGVDLVAIGWRDAQASADRNAEAHSTAGRNVSSGTPLPTQGSVLVGSYRSIAAMLDEMASIEGLEGVMLSFDEFREGIDAFGRHILPLMESRRRSSATAAA
ncbi:pyrimidine utilization protein A [Roseomonas sp. OT10]|uniref:pyrimidine utilization protein A n=1 Tax=Roseomonas cutis TaxID=2897332 RepID=UPI001E32C44A|nr:pyrimidine utilization protein A [Roseomonas sp. OT10]UFN48506.1 pyrimidine utilization protein A [Roseomonas sp. OT10]